MQNKFIKFLIDIVTFPATIVIILFLMVCKLVLSIIKDFHFLTEKTKRQARRYYSEMKR